MCQKVIINRGEKEIESPNEFKQHFGFLPKDAENGELDLCMCNCDLDATFIENGIEYGICAFGDYYVGDLDKCELIHRHDPNMKQEEELGSSISLDDVKELQESFQTKEENKRRLFQHTEREDGASTFNGVKVTHNIEIACSVDVGVEKDKQEVTIFYIEDATEIDDQVAANLFNPNSQRISGACEDEVRKVFRSVRVGYENLNPESKDKLNKEIGNLEAAAEKGANDLSLLLQRAIELGKMSKRKKRRNRHKRKKKLFTFTYQPVSLPPTEEEIIRKLIPIVKKEFL